MAPKVFFNVIFSCKKMDAKTNVKAGDGDNGDIIKGTVFDKVEKGDYRKAKVK